MRFTILDNPRYRVTLVSLALVCAASLPAVVVPGLGDPFQAPRMALAALAVAVLIATGNPAPTTADRRVTWAVAAVAAWYVIAAIAAQPGSSLWGVQGRMNGLLGFFILVAAGAAGARLPRRSLVTLGTALAAVTALVSGLVLVQALIGSLPTGTFGNSAIAGAWLAVGCGTALATARVHPRAQLRPWLLASAGLGALAAGAAGSRAAIVAIGIAGAVVLATGGSGSARKALVTVAVGVALLAGGVALAVEPGKFDPASLGTGSALSRVEIWKSTATMVAANPVFGVGPGRFLYEFPRYQSLAHARAEAPDTRPDQAHSLPLQFAAEGGVPVGLAVLALGAVAVAHGWRAARSGDGAAMIALGGLAAYLAQALLGVAAVETDLVGWLLAGAAIASTMHAQELPAASAPGLSPTRLAAVIGVLALAGVSLWYVAANAAYGRGLDRYAQADFKGSIDALATATARDPLTDVYRVARADSASYLGEAERLAALAHLETGLDIEPRSYDLALSRARMLSLLRRPADEVASAYLDALALYPHGITVRTETVEALRAAGLDERATAEAALLEALLAPPEEVR